MSFRRIAAALGLLLATLLAGCASGPRTQVVLLPDHDGHVGAVVVSNAAGAQPIDRAYAGVTAGGSAAPGAARVLQRPEVDARYAPLMALEPTHPVSYTLFFVLDSTELTAQSKALLPQVLDSARARQPTRITVYGHADATGNERHNLQLSEARARAVLGALRRAHPNLGDIELQWFGEQLPLLPDNPRDPRNRRAEIVIL